jgi:beta-ureidopropionase / N-carbamoyl-L-amino-acid hydrolase
MTVSKLADNEAKTVARHVNAERQWQFLMKLAKFGETPNGGVHRLALSDEEAGARLFLISKAEELGLSIHTDTISNLFFRLEGKNHEAPPIVTGSHIDTQPKGGKFDGAYGVVAGFEAIRAIRDAGLTPNRSVEVVAWLNEEGSRFSPGMMGSEAYTGQRSIEQIMEVKDADGDTTREALARIHKLFPDTHRRPMGMPIAAYIEAHIEQGPILDENNIPVGIVTGIQGSRRFRITVTGEESHAGTTPRKDRKDALFAAQDMISKMRNAFDDSDDLVKFTVGLFNVLPNAPSVVPSEVFFSIDLRHPDWPTLNKLGEAISEICEENRGKCAFSVKEVAKSPSLTFPHGMQNQLTAIANELDIQNIPILSAAGHDARQLHYFCPAGMIFVPCDKGISHNELENCNREDLAEGTRLLAAALVGLSLENLNE